MTKAKHSVDDSDVTMSEIVRSLREMQESPGGTLRMLRYANAERDPILAKILRTTARFTRPKWTRLERAVARQASKRGQ